MEGRLSRRIPRDSWRLSTNVIWLDRETWVFFVNVNGVLLTEYAIQALLDIQEKLVLCGFVPTI